MENLQSIINKVKANNEKVERLDNYVSGNHSFRIVSSRLNGLDPEGQFKADIVAAIKAEASRIEESGREMKEKLHMINELIK